MGANGGFLRPARRVVRASMSVPGGKAPAKLKKEKEAVEFVRQFCRSGKPVGAICHGPQLLAEAGVITGKKIAAWPDCEKEVEEAGALYQYAECMKDGPFITGRWPGDLPAQMKAVMEALAARQLPQKQAA